MIWDSGTVFVLGAGFTKAFLPQAPLLTDDYGGDELKRKFASFPEALAVLEMELAHPDHPPGWMNLERLMTRLAGGMPYDFQTGAEKPLGLLLSAVKDSFVRRLAGARECGSVNQGELWLLAGHCTANRINCLTFNYDDLLDEALWRSGAPYGWSPDSGYGFPCRVSENTVMDPRGVHRASTPMFLLKLHGSVNWRMSLGHPRPYAVDGILHHEPWFMDSGSGKMPLGAIERFLETDPLLVPPVLTKTDLVQQPILRLIWSLAVNALKEAKRVVFIGYSLPPTDIAAGFLFREGLRHLNHATAVTVVDFAMDEEEREKKRATLQAAYRNVFPTINSEQFDFSGGENWVRDNLTEWLYDSQGNPVAYKALDHIVARDGRFIGTIRSYFPGRQDIWHGRYKGEIFNGNRFLRVHPPPTNDRGGGAPSAMPQVPRIPDRIGPISLPEDYRDVDLAEG